MGRRRRQRHRPAVQADRDEGEDGLGHLVPLFGVPLAPTGLDRDAHGAAAAGDQVDVDRNLVADGHAGERKVIASTATVTALPRATRMATSPPARSICAISQPPKMSPLGLASAGIAVTRIAGCGQGRARENRRTCCDLRAGAARAGDAPKLRIGAGGWESNPRESVGEAIRVSMPSTRILPTPPKRPIMHQWVSRIFPTVKLAVARAAGRAILPTACTPPWP